MKSLGALAFAVCFVFSASTALSQGDLGKGKRDRGQGSQSQSQGGSKDRGQGGGSSSGGGLGKSQGGGSSSGGSSSGRGQGGGSSTGSGSSSGGLGRGRDQGGGSSSGGSSSGGGYGRSQGGGSTSSGGGLGRSQGGGTSSSGGSNSRSQGEGGLGRVNDDRLNRTNSIGKGSGSQGRSGGSGYGSNNNKGRGDGTFRIESPQLNLNKGSLSSQVFRTETVRVNSRWRDGYYAYNDNWRDDNFYYPHYAFNPYGHNRDCTVSPWYYYPNLPAYIWSSRIFYYSNTSCEWGIGSVYQWNRRNDNYGWSSTSRNNSDLDDAVDDLVNIFERGDRRALSRLVPRSGRVNIYMDSQYCYSLDSDDFYDLLLDNVQSTRTSRYTINRVTTYRDTAQVSASHEYTDPWGRRQCVYHNYRLESDRYGYVITDFLTSGRP